MASWPKSELELAQEVVRYLQDDGWEVYQEVQILAGCGIADIVAKKGQILWFIECKRSLELNLIAQASEWKDHGDYVSIAVPRLKRRSSRKGRSFAYKILQWQGIGAFELYKSRGHRGQEGEIYVEERLEPALQAESHFKKTALAKLHESMKDFAKAGNANGNRWTPFKQTCLNLTEYVVQNPGCYLSDAMKSIPHHYRSDVVAIARMAKNIRQNHCSTLDIYKDKGRNRLKLRN